MPVISGIKIDLLTALSTTYVGNSSRMLGLYYGCIFLSIH